MRPADLEKLLGGYATGTLTQAERKALFEAALQDQGLFDALAEEEALRETLADPLCRRQMLAALDASMPPLREPVFAWLRRPMPWALAGSLASAILIATVVLRHSPPAPVARRTQQVQMARVEPPAPETAPAPVTAAPESEPKPARKRQFVPRALPQVASVPDLPPASSAPAVQPSNAPAGGVVGGAIGGVPGTTAPPPPPAPRASAIQARTEAAEAAGRVQTDLSAVSLFHGGSRTAADRGKTVPPYSFAGYARPGAELVLPGFGFRYRILKRQTGGQYVETDPAETFRSADSLRVAVEPNARGYLYVLRQGAAGAWVPVPGPVQNRVEARARYVLPETGAIPPGKLLVLFSREPQSQVEPARLEQSRSPLLEKVRHPGEIAVYVIDPTPAASRVWTEINLVR